MESINDVVVREITDRGIFICPNVIERMTASIGSHVMNLCNMDHKFILKGRAPANFRTHLVYISPSGWTKSFYFRMFLKHFYGILWNDNRIFPIDVHSTFSTAAWFGTIGTNKDGETEERKGVFETYKRGIIGADDYQPLIDLFDGTGKGQDEIALMTALDTDEAVKNLALGQLRIKGVGLTAWFGLRPTRLKLTSGLARRFTFPRFFPNRKEAAIFRDLARNELTPNLEYEFDEMEPPLERAINDTDKLIVDAGVCDIDFEQVHDYLNTFRTDSGVPLIPHFEENIYRNIALGWSVANGNYPSVRMDDVIKGILLDEYQSRQLLRTEPFRMMFHRILMAEEDHSMSLSELKLFLTNFLQFSENETEMLIMTEKRAKRIEFDKKGRKIIVTLIEPED